MNLPMPVGGVFHLANGTMAAARLTFD